MTLLAASRTPKSPCRDPRNRRRGAGRARRGWPVAPFAGVDPPGGACHPVCHPDRHLGPSRPVPRLQRGLPPSLQSQSPGQIVRVCTLPGDQPPPGPRDTHGSSPRQAAACDATPPMPTSAATRPQRWHWAATSSTERSPWASRRRDLLPVGRPAARAPFPGDPVTGCRRGRSGRPRSRPGGDRASRTRAPSARPRRAAHDTAASSAAGRTPARCLSFP